MKSEMPIEKQQDFYNRRWKEFTFANRLKLARCIGILDGLLQTGLKEPKIIDLGCGAGWLTNILSMFGPTTGVDLSSLGVAEANQKYPHVNFIQADIMAWDYPKEAFDLVVSQEMLEHVEAQAAYLDITYGLLRTGGYLILTTPNSDTFNAMPENNRNSWSNQPIENWLTLRELKRLTRRRFKLIRVTTLIPGYGEQGSYRFVNSYYLTGVFGKLGAQKILNNTRLALGYGLHSLVVAKKV